MSNPIVNKVKQNTKLINFDLEKLYPEVEIEELDIKPFLFQELILKEKDFRDHLDNFNWSQFNGKILATYCSSDAIIPPWAYMLIASKSESHASEIIVGDKKEALITLYNRILNDIDWDAYKEKFVMIKGCSDKYVPDEVYAYTTSKLMKTASKIMYGEACSNVPIWRK